MSGRTRATGLAWLVVGWCVNAPALARADDVAAPDAKQVCIAAAERGQTERDEGKYRQAHASFLACSQDSCPRIIQQSCTKWLHELDESAPTIVVAAKDEQGNDLTDVNVTFDGSPMASQLDGKPVEVDVGEHVLRVERPGGAVAEQKILVRAGEKARVVAVTLHLADGSVERPAEAPERGPARNIVGASLSAGALVAAGIGTFFLLRSNHDKSSAGGLRSEIMSSSACTSPTSNLTGPCQALRQTVSSQHDEVNVATGLFVGAGVLAAGALATWLWPRARSSEPQAPEATGSIVPLARGAAMQLSGRF